MHVRSARAHTRTLPARRVITWLSVAVVSIGAIVSIAVANRSVPSIAESAPLYNQLVLNTFYEKYETRVDFVAVTGSPYAHDRTSPESMPDVLGFVQYFRVQYPVAFDGSLAIANNICNSPRLAAMKPRAGARADCVSALDTSPKSLI
jgi:hypothetical protein